MLERLVPALLFLTGASGLLYEVVLGRYLALYLGSSGASQAITLAAFLGGMAAGSLVIGRHGQRVFSRIGPVDRAGGPIRAYAALEAFVGCWAVALPTLSEIIFDAYFALTTGSGLPGAVTAPLKLGVAMTLIVPLTFAMGATLPALAAGVLRLAPDRAVPLVSRYYYVNAAGGAAGAMLTGFWLIEAVGLDDALYLGALLNFVVALLVLKATESLDTAPRTAPEDGRAQRPAKVATAAGPALPVWIFAAGTTGLVTLVYEVVWTRLAGLTLGASVYSFALMLTVVIAGISVGSAIATGLLRRRLAPTTVLSWSQIGAALSAVALTWRMGQVAEDIFFMRARLLPREDDYAMWLLIAGGVFALHLLPGAICLGAAFPSLLAGAARSGASADKATAWILGTNTLGNLAGSMAGGYLLMPWLGLEGVLAAGALLSAGNALLVSGRSIGIRRGVALGVVASSAVLTLVLPPERAQIDLGLFRQRAKGAEAARAIIDKMRREVGFLFRKDGRDATLTVESYPGNHIIFRTNGKPDGGTGDVPTQVLLGHVPFLFKLDIQDAFIVGLGTGQTAAAVVSHPGTRVTVAELLPEVLEAVRFFDSVNDHVLDSPRVTVRVTDAREALREAAPGSYDLVVSEPSNPWVVGVADLFTQEHFELTRSRLRPDGVLVQWIHTYEIGDAVLREIICTVRGVFPAVEIFRVTAGDIILVASAARMAVDPDLATQHFEDPSVRASLTFHARDDVPVDAEGFVALQLCGPTHVDRLCAAFDEPLRERHPSIEYRAPRAFFAGAGADGLLERLDLRVHPNVADDMQLARWLAARPLTDERRERLRRLFDARGVGREQPLMLSVATHARRPVEEQVLERGLPPLEGGGSLDEAHARALCEWLDHAHVRPFAVGSTIFGPVSSQPRLNAWALRCHPRPP